MERVVSHCGIEFSVSSGNMSHCVKTAARKALKLPKSTYFALFSAVTAKTACNLLVYAGKLRKNIV